MEDLTNTENEFKLNLDIKTKKNNLEDENYNAFRLSDISFAPEEQQQKILHEIYLQSRFKE